MEPWLRSHEPDAVVAEGLVENLMHQLKLLLLTMQKLWCQNNVEPKNNCIGVHDLKYGDTFAYSQVE